jgi:hypothetical protein
MAERSDVISALCCTDHAENIGHDQSDGGLIFDSVQKPSATLNRKGIKPNIWSSISFWAGRNMSNVTDLAWSALRKLCPFLKLVSFTSPDGKKLSPTFR